MGFKSGSYATVWEVKGMSPTMTKVRLSLDRKNKMTDQYEQEFGDFVIFVGTAAASKALKLKPKDRIKLGDVDVSNKYNKERGVTFYDFKVFDFEYADGANSGGNTGRTPSQSVPRPRAASPTFDDAPMLDDEDVPF